MTHRHQQLEDLREEFGHLGDDGEDDGGGCGDVGSFRSGVDGDGSRIGGCNSEVVVLGEYTNHLLPHL